MKIQEMTKEDFAELPWRQTFCCEIKPFKSLVIIPQQELHDSGYMMMDFAAVDENDEPFMLLAGGSDVLCLDGIGGYGELPRGLATYSSLPRSRPVQGWAIDCLPCGYLRLFCNGLIRAGAALSSFEIIWLPRET